MSNFILSVLVFFVFFIGFYVLFLQSKCVSYEEVLGTCE